MISLTPANSMLAVTDLVFSGIFKRFPTLRIAMSEGGTGWLPYMLERMNYVHAHHNAWTGTDLGGKRPSEIFHEHFWTCFIEDRIGVKLLDDVGVDHSMWELDYPHSDSTWPNAPELLWESISGLPDDTINKITHENAMRCFQFDPFQHRAKERCTVAALRAEASDVDVSIKTMGRRKADANSLKTLLAAASKGADA
jgi:predicted TIM-barrel fold metal-dependent hydrolase